MPRNGAVVAVIKIRREKLPAEPPTIYKLTAAALVLPGLIPIFVNAADDDSVDFQYSHYQEGKLDIYGLNFLNNDAPTKLPQNLNPIEVDGIHGSARVSLTDRIKFSFNYLQDTWSGATPLGTAPVVAGGNAMKLTANQTGGFTMTDASPVTASGHGMVYIFTDRNLKKLLPSKL